MSKYLKLFVLLLVALIGIWMSAPGSVPAQADVNADTPTTADIENPNLGVPSAIKNMYHPTRFPDVYLLTRPYCLFTTRADYAKILKGQKPDTVASHGSLWNYDSDIPIIFYGKGIKEGYLGAEARLIDIAPTLAYLAGVQRPAAASGRVLTEILKPEAATWTSQDRPKVLVLFSLDQCRNDHLRTFERAFAYLTGNIIAKGATFGQGRVTDAKTETAVSHATVGTGAIAGMHGIVGNNVMLPNGTYPLAVDDGNAGPNNGHGDLNPYNLLVPTLADELDRRYDNKSIVISSSSYGRAAIGVAGHGAYYQGGDYVYPGADKDIVFITNWYSGVPYTNTDFYALPDYLNVGLNPDVAVKPWLKKYYGLDLDTSKWTGDLTIRDKGPYAITEAPIGNPTSAFPWGEKYSFSYPMIKAGEAEPDQLQRYQDYKSGVTVLTEKYSETVKTPFFDLWNFDLNLMTMEREGVGQDNVPDFVFFHLKSLDAVGHKFGIYSGEIYSYMFFADYMIQKVITWLDRNVGKGNYVTAFFGDHGGTNIPTRGQWIINEELKEALEGQFGAGVLKQQGGDQLWLDQAVLQAKGKTNEDVARWMEAGFPWLVRAYTKNEVITSGKCQ
ncbi:MAG: alkaline phosphatase family protein [Deltaproteobacteria bacterium]|nr:alkaline phosphatase family protein [Deltaproteobacteria bacterium]